MASTFSKSFALFLSLNILFFTLVSSCGECESHGPKPRPRPRPSPGSGSKGGGSYPGSGGIPIIGGGVPVVGGGIPVVGGGIPVVGGGVPVVGGGIPVVGGGVPVVGGGIPIIGGGTPVVGGGSPSTGGGSSSGSCPIDALKLGVCANVLNTLLNVTLGTPPVTPCCPLIQGLVDLEAAVCLCTAIKANILGINLNIPISLSLLINHCGGKVPRGFQCP